MTSFLKNKQTKQPPPPKDQAYFHFFLTVWLNIGKPQSTVVWDTFSFHYLDSRLFPEKRNGPTDLYEGWDFVIQENNLFKTRLQIWFSV